MLAEIIGAIAVVVALFYVASQIRQNTRAVKSATAQSVHEHYASWYQLLAGDGDLSQIVVNALKDYAALSEAEKALPRGSSRIEIVVTEIDLRSSCGNSPKSQLLQDLVIAIGKADRHRIESALLQDVQWQPVGRQPILGRDSCIKALTRYGPATRVVIDHVISHGKAGSVNGFVEFGEKRRGFCYVFEFGNAKGENIRGITSYSVPIV